MLPAVATPLSAREVIRLSDLLAMSVPVFLSLVMVRVILNTR